SGAGSHGGGGGYGGGGGGHGGNGYGAGYRYGQEAGATYVPAPADLLSNEGSEEKLKAESRAQSARPVGGSPRNIIGAGRTGRTTWEIELAHSLDQPPLVEIHSGRALNTILKELTSAGPNALLSRPSMTLRPDVLGHINLRPVDVDLGNPAI